MYKSNLLKNKSTMPANEKARQQDELKRATNGLKDRGFRVIKKPRYNQFVLLDLKRGKIHEGRGYSLNLRDLTDMMLYYYYKYTAPRQERVQTQVEKLQKNPRLCGEYAEGPCDDSHYRGYNIERGEIRKVDNRLEKRAKAFNLIVICYPYHIYCTDYLHDAYIVFDRKTGELLGTEGWKTWTKHDVEQYLDKLEKGEITR